MQRFLNNIFTSKAHLMVVLRLILGGLIVYIGILRTRIVVLSITCLAHLQQSDILQEYLMAKAMVTGLNPYLQMDKLAQIFNINYPLFNHPSPYPPFIAILFIPFSIFSPQQVSIIWFIIELICLIAISGMLTVLWKGKINWIWTIFITFILLAWFPVMVDLFFGQLTILLTTLVLAALILWRRDKKILAGVVIGLSVAIKMFTWPLIIFLALKKDWRTFFSAGITVFGINLVALVVMGIGPIADYYLHVTTLITNIYLPFLKNYSLWSIGYRLFEGTRPIGGDFISAPPLIYLPKIAPLVSAGIAAAFLILGLSWALRSKDKEIAYSIMLCVSVAVSPISWDHYYIMAIVGTVILLLELAKRSFPNWLSLSFIIITFLSFMVNEYIYLLMLQLSGGFVYTETYGNRISFPSSLIVILPIAELIILTYLLWKVTTIHTDSEIAITNAST